MRAFFEWDSPVPVCKLSVGGTTPLLEAIDGYPKSNTRWMPEEGLVPFDIQCPRLFAAARGLVHARIRWKRHEPCDTG